MPLAVESRHIVLHNGPVATGTLGREQIEVVVLAVGFSLLLMEAVFTELFAALGAEEMLRVPCLLQGGDAFI